MANTLLTPQDITREALVVFHQKANFIGSVNTDYDDRFANEGAKIGDTLQIRLPNEYVIRRGRTLATQDTVEQKVDLVCQEQLGVDLNFTSRDLTLDLDDFSRRIIQPAVAVLVANVEADFYQYVYKRVPNFVDGGTMTFDVTQDARAKLAKQLVPADGQWYGTLDPDATTQFVKDTKGLFQSSSAIAEQYRTGLIGQTGSFTFQENTHFSSHTTGTSAEGDTTYNINGASQVGGTLTIDTGTTTFLEGDLITIDGVNRVHPETKADTGELMQFVVRADSGTSATSLSIYPDIVTTGGRQNVTGSPADNAAINKLGAGASGLIGGSMFYHKDAFTFATADLVMPNGTDMAAREVLDGVSMRMVRDYDINDDQMPCRLDIIPAYAAQRPLAAVRAG